MQRRSVRCLVVGTLILFAIVTVALAKKNKRNISVVIDQQSLEGRPQGVSSAWLGYAVARANWISDHVKANTPQAKSYKRTFEEELAGRDMLVTIWGELKTSEAGLADPYLDQLQRVKDAGLVREYVWINLRSAEWTQEPEQLQLDRYTEWAKSNLVGHVVETRAEASLQDEAAK